MLASKQFRNMIPFMNRSGNRLRIEHFTNLDACQVVDPMPSSWGTNGLAPVEGEDTLHMDIQGAATLLMMQFNDKVLPGSTRDEEVRKRVAKLTEDQGRKPGKKEYREIRDEVEMVLLAKAMVRRSFVPILLVGDFILVFTSSMKRAETAITQLMVGYGPNADKQIRLHNLHTCVVNNVQNTIGAIAKTLPVESEEEAIDFTCGSVVVLKGGEKQVIRIKDKDVGSHDVQELLKQDYTVERVGVHAQDFDESLDLADFVLTDKMIFTGIKADGVKPDKEPDALFNNIWLTAQTMKKILQGLIETLGGLHPIETMDAASEPAAAAPSTVAAFDEDDSDEI